jgi:methylenetetrahydrofolate dehydrogenase (NADP+) / methenyltetrahydrofolate cyclohydrolase
MSTVILDGKATAKAIRRELKKEISTLDYTPTLAVILVGKDPASTVYVSSKEKACKWAGLKSINHHLDASTDSETLRNLIIKLNNDPTVDGILLQLPLPSHMDEESLLMEIIPEKDVDGFHPVNQGKVLLGATKGLIPCTPYGIIELLQRYDINPSGKEAVIVGRSSIVGRPIAALLISLNATVTVCHTKTKDLKFHVSRADLLVIAAGRRNIVDSSWIKKDAVVIDVGIHRLDDGTLTGDIEFDQAHALASAITPVPGGIGPMTIAMLLKNTVLAAKLRRSN